VHVILLVTGASRGIGRATALLAAERGYDVCVNYLHQESAAARVAADIEQVGRRALAVKADVASEADVVRLFAEIDRGLGPVGALVNNAGIIEQQMRVESMTAERLTRVFAVNAIGPLLCAREAVRRMSTKKGGRGGSIVNVSSAAARIGSAGEYVDYAATKGALETLTLGLAREVAGEGIRVNAVRAGHIYTDIHASGGEPHRVDRLKDTIPMKRGGDPAEVARAILWLLSDEASYVTGTFLDVTGGR
jgi:NAD(P)-dependent dehydrogenase (short-subunit alcohol dehydrogenase family)